MVLGFGGNFKGCCAVLVECACVQCSAVRYSAGLSFSYQPAMLIRKIYISTYTCSLRMGVYIFLILLFRL